MIPLFKPYMPKDIPEIENILHSGDLAYGNYTKLFEDKLKEYFDSSYIVATNSFQLAIFVMLTALDIKPGDEVIASPMGCLVSTQPYVAYGLKVVWADVDPETGTLAPESVQKKITNKTKMIIHNHFCGFPGYIDEINRIGKVNNIIVVDDGIECFGSLYKDKKIGNCGTDVTVFSFGAVRIPNTIEGGAIVFNKKEIYEKALLICDNGIDRHSFRDIDGEINPNCDIALRGYNAKMSNVNGYIGLCQMSEVDKLIAHQRANAIKWKEKEMILDVREIKKTSQNNSPNYWVYGVLVKDKKKAIANFRAQGYYASGVHINNNIYSIFENKEVLEGTQYFQEHFIALPCGWWM